jgi:aminoglycoside 6'-N-acetyltransferase
MGRLMPRLRTATVADIPLLRTWDADPVVSAATGGAGSHEWDAEIARDLAWREFLIAEADGVPVGFVCLIEALEEETHYWGFDEQPGAWAIDIWIGSAEHRGRGYGESMMRQALDRCFDLHGATTVLIDPLAVNVDAIRFYERLGFTRVSERWFDHDLVVVHRFDRPA